MVATLDSLGISQLPLDQKLKLVGQLWDDILSTRSRTGLLSKARQDEIQRRMDDARTNPEDYVAWEDALAATLRRINSLN